MRVETHKLHRVGRSSLSVILPSWWTQANGLGPGDAVAFFEEDEFSIALSAVSDNEARRRSALLEVGSDWSPEKLERVLIGSYLIGADSIELHADPAFTRDQMDMLRATVPRLTGLTIMGADERTFLARGWLDPSYWTLDETLHRMLSLTETALGHVPGLVSKNVVKAAQEVLALGEQSDRLYYLTVRLLLLAVCDRALAKRMHLRNQQEAIGCRLIAKALEEVVDSVEVLAAAVSMPQQGAHVPDPEVSAAVRGFTGRLAANLKKGVDAFFSRSVEEADRQLGDILGLKREIDSFVREATGGPSLSSGQLSPECAAKRAVVATTLHDVCRYARLVDEAALNHAILTACLDRKRAPARPLKEISSP